MTIALGLSAGERAGLVDAVGGAAVVTTGELARLYRPGPAIRPGDLGATRKCLAAIDDHLQRVEAVVGERRRDTWLAVPEIERLLDQRRALERRLVRLEAAAGDPTSAAALADPTEVEYYLLARLAEARRDKGTVVLDDAFAPMPTDHKRDLLRFLLRMAEHVAIVYVTADRDTIAWAEARRSGSHLDVVGSVGDDAPGKNASDARPGRRPVPPSLGVPGRATPVPPVERGAGGRGRADAVTASTSRRRSRSRR
jgi:hypothetical protein